MVSKPCRPIRVLLLWVLVLAAMGRLESQADIIVTISEKAGTVTFSASGSLNLSLLGPSSTAAVSSILDFDSDSSMLNGNGTYREFKDNYGSVTFASHDLFNFSPVGSAGSLGYTEFSGERHLWVPATYVSETEISYALTSSDAQVVTWFNNVSGTSWGATLTSGESITFTAVPEPSAAFLSLVPALGLLLCRRRPGRRYS